MAKRTRLEKIQGKAKDGPQNPIDPGTFDPILDAISNLQPVLGVPFLLRIQLSCTSSAKIETDPQPGEGTATASTRGLSDEDAQRIALDRAERNAEKAAKRELQRQAALITCASPCKKIVTEPTTQSVGLPETKTEDASTFFVTATRYRTTVQAVAKATVKCVKLF